MPDPAVKPDATGFPIRERDDLIAASLDWLTPPLAHMFALLKGGQIPLSEVRPASQQDLGVLFNANPLQTPAQPEPQTKREFASDEALDMLRAALGRKIHAYLFGEESQHRLSLIDQQDYDTLVSELARFKVESDAHDTALGFLEAHLSHLYGRKLIRDSNPYSLRNLAQFVLEGLASQELPAGIRRGMLRDFLDQIVPDMQSSLWDLANRLEPLASQMRLNVPVKQETAPVAMSTPDAGLRGWLGSSGNTPEEESSRRKVDKGEGSPSNPQDLLEKLLGALESFGRYAASTSAVDAAVPQLLARWASVAPVKAERETVQGVRAASFIQQVPGLNEEQASIFDALSPAVMKTVAEDRAVLDDAAHPLRVLLNRATEIAAAGVDPRENAQIREWAESAGRGLLRQPGEVTRWLGELDRLGAGALIRRQERLMALQLELEGWHRMLRARQRANETLSRALAGKRLPREAAAFCDGTWRHVLAMIALRHNPGTQVWLDAQNLINDFARAPVTEEKLAQIRQIMSREMQSFFAVEEPLPVWLGQLAQPADAQQLMGWIDRQQSGSGDAAPVDSERLELGDWVRFADKPAWPYPLQLIWTSLPYGWFGFADMEAGQIYRIEREELTAHLGRGRVERFGRTAFDRLPGLMDMNIASWAYEDQLLSTLRDPETGFLNRRGLLQALAATVVAGNDPRWQTTVVDIPGLAGHFSEQAGGEARLAGIATLLRGLGKPGMMIARIGETHFALASGEPGEDLARELQQRAQEHYKTHAELHFSIGCCPDAPPGEELLRFAEQACMDASEAGRGQLRAHAWLTAQSEDWMRAVTRVMGENRLELFVQPMRPLKHGLPGHGEILLRLRAKDGQFVSPALFLHEAERQKLITQVDHWVLRTVCGKLADYQLPEGMEAVSVNLSGQTITDLDSIREIEAVLDASGVAPERIIFEVTETAAVLDPVRTSAFLARLRERGCRIALDDFGTGYANYSYLRQMPFDYLKIDGSFVRDLLHKESDRALVKSMCDVARNLGISSIAEFVHDEAMLPLLIELGADYAQGYAISPPEELAGILTYSPMNGETQNLALSST